MLSMNHQCKESHVRVKNGFILDWITQATVHVMSIMRMAITEARPEMKSPGIGPFKKTRRLVPSRDHDKRFQIKEKQSNVAAKDYRWLCVLPLIFTSREKNASLTPLLAPALPVLVLAAQPSLPFVEAAGQERPRSHR